MNDDAAKKVTEPRASEIDAKAIMRQIRADIHKQRAQAEAQGQGKDFVEEPYASQVTTRFDHRLYDALQRMSDGYDKVGVGLLLTESRLPFIAPLVLGEITCSALRERTDLVSVPSPSLGIAQG